MRFLSSLFLLLVSWATFAQTKIDSLPYLEFLKVSLKVSKNMTLDVVDGTIPMGITFLSSLKVRDSTSNVNSEYTFYADGTPWSLKHSTGDSSFVMLSWYESGDLKSRSYYERNKLVSSDLWHDNGQKMRDVNLVDGKRQGHAIWYNENGTKSAEGYYKNDEQVGKWKFYDKNGKLTRIKEM